MARTRSQGERAPGPADRGRRLLAAVALGPILPLLAVLIYYFATRWEADWVLVAALGLCAVAAGARLVAVFLPGRSR
jgi:hypothetical protein